jgi:TP901 family phage tail tape measure protein
MANAFKLLGEIALQGAEKVKSALNDVSNRAQQTGEKLKGMGESLSKITTPLTALGAGAMASANQLQTAQGSMQAQLGLTGKEAERLNKQAQSLWKQGFGENMQDVTNKVATVTRSLGELNNQDLKTVVGGMDVLEKQFGADTQESMNAVKTLMDKFGMSATEAMDYLTAGYQQNLNYSGEFTDTIREYSTYFAEMGMSGDQMFSVLKSGAESGAFQLDKVGDSMKEFTLRSKDGSKSSTEAFQALGLNATEMTNAFNKGGETGRLAFQKVVTALNNTKSETERNKIATALFGTQYEDLGEEAFNAMLKASSGMTNVEGASKKASDAMRANFGVQLQQVWRQLQDALMPLGQTLINMAQVIIPPLSSAIQKLASWFQKLSPAGQAVVAVMGVIAGAIGPVITVLGSVVGSLGTLIPKVMQAWQWLSKLGPTFTIVRTALTALTGPVGLVIAGITALVTAGVLLWKNWDNLGKSKFLLLATPVGQVVGALKLLQSAFQSSIPPVDLFGNKVSATTEKAVSSFLKLGQQGMTSLTYLSTSGTTVSAQMATNIGGKFDQMANTVINALEKQKTQGLQKQTEFFNQSSVLSTQKEAEITAKTAEGYNQRIQKTQEGNARIQEILTNASANHRSISTQELNEITKIKNQMTTNGIQALSKNEIESKTILERMKANSGTINAQMAVDVVKQSIKARDGAIKSANETYDKKIAQIIKMRDETGVISAQEADKMIKEAGRQKDDTIKKANEMHTQVVASAKKQAGDHAQQVDWEKGQVKTKWQEMKTDVINKANEMKTKATQKITELKTQAVNKFNELKSQATSKFNEIKTQVTNKASELKTNAVSRFNDLKSSATKIFNSAKTAMVNPINSAKTSIGNALDKIKGFFSSLRGKLKIELPRNIATPHFKVMRWSANPKNWITNGPPYIDIQWYKKGGYFDQASIIGIGEEGPEMALPLIGKRMRPFAQAVAQMIPDFGTKETGTLSDNLRIEVPVYLNGKEMARAVAPDMDRALERIRQTQATFRRLTT